MWVKYSMPRVRIDHMLAFNWKFLVPLSLVVLMMTAVLDKVLAGLPGWAYTLGMFGANIIVAVITIEILRAYGRKQQKSKQSLSPAARNQEQVP